MSLMVRENVFYSYAINCSGSLVKTMLIYKKQLLTAKIIH